MVHVRSRAAADDVRTIDGAGLVTVAIELGLGDLPGVVPTVEGAPAWPVLDDMARVAEARWELDLTVATDKELLTYEGSLCGPDAPCILLTGRVDPSDPGPGVVRILERIEAELGVSPDAEAADARIRKASKDPYAYRLAGRAAAILYGLRPPADKPWDKRADPVRRAVLVDPSLPEAGYVAGRVLLDRGRTMDPLPGGKPVEDLIAGLVQRPLVARPSSVLLRAVEASALTELDRDEAADLLWFDLVEATADDPRFLVAGARSALRLDRPRKVESLMVRVPAVAVDDPVVTELRARAAAGGDPGFLDERLAEWALAEPELAEPIHARIGLRVRQDRFEEALALVPELSTRGVAEEESARLERALVAAIDRSRLPGEAPGRTFPEFRTELVALERAVPRQRAWEEATARLQNRAAEAGAMGRGCADPDQHGRRAQLLGVAWQSRATELDRRGVQLVADIDGELVQPLLDEASAGRARAVARRAADASVRAAEAARWSAQHLRPCDVPLKAHAGAPRIFPDDRDVAVLAVGPAVLCPDGRVVDEGPQALLVGAADEVCLDTTDACGCAPEPAAPGAVLVP